MEKQKETESCQCKKEKCKRHGNCEECIAYHEEHKRFLPYCKRNTVKGKQKRDKINNCQNSEKVL